MGRGFRGQGAGAGDVAGHGGDAPSPVRQAELPVCERPSAARAGGVDLLVQEPGAVGDASGGDGRAGAGRDRALPPGPCEVGSAGECGAGGAGEQPGRQPKDGQDAFGASRVVFEGLTGLLGGAETADLTHQQLESLLDRNGRGLLRQLLQDHFDLRARRERRASGVVDADGVAHQAIEYDHRRSLETIFGEVTLTRLAYRAKRAANLYVADAGLNLPRERHSHGVRERCAIEAARGSYQEATAAMARTTGATVGKRQVEALAVRAAVDFEGFYQHKHPPVAAPGEVVVLSVDGKGIVMRPDGLRAQTARAAQQSSRKLKGRLSKGEKSNRKRMAEVGAVYTVAPVPRTPEDVMARHGDADGAKQAPKAAHKWVTASVAEDAATVIAQVFDEAQRRDPGKQRAWIALVDGNCHQINRIQAEADARGVEVRIMVDWVHVLEYLWSAAWSFFTEGDPAAEDWVHAKALDVLAGRASIVAAGIRRKATTLNLDNSTRKNADTCADYLLSKAPYLDYPAALSAGMPIATGVIEGACRHIVKDRMDITGARWGLHGAEAVLKLRALRTNGDWQDYWSFHLTQEHNRVHHSRYLNSAIPRAA